MFLKRKNKAYEKIEKSAVFLLESRQPKLSFFYKVVFNCLEYASSFFFLVFTESMMN